MSYRPHIQAQYQIAEPGKITTGLAVDIEDQPAGRATVLFEPGEIEPWVISACNQLANHQIVHGLWRQRWTHDDRMRRPGKGLSLNLSRWERVPGHLLPDGHAVWVIEEAGSCVWLVNEDGVTQRLVNDMNDLLFRFVGDGLWLQIWFRRHIRLAQAAAPLPIAPASPLVMA